MTKYAIACLISGILGAALGAQVLEEVPAPHLSAEAQAGQVSGRTAPRTDLPATPASAPVAFSAEERQNIRVYETANPSVVNISTRSVHYDRFFGLENTSEGSGSGSILDTSGHVLTNFHVVDGAQDIEVTLASGKTYQATIIGYDRIDDLCILEIDAPQEDLHPITFGDSANLKVGQKVYAVGNPFGWERTMTTGIISGLNRTLPSRAQHRTMKALIQTDAAMNPGNSGGPLLDSGARMIGMNVAIATGEARQNSGVGFAIPINRIKRQVRELIEFGKVTRGDIGILHALPVDEGLLVAVLARGGPAEEAGLQPVRVIRERRQRGFLVYETQRYDIEHADIITAIDGKPVDSPSELIEATESKKPGEVVTLTILRDGRRQNLDVTLGAR